MKLFLDTAQVTFIEKWANSGLIDGVTTNPSHLSQSGDVHNTITKICNLLPNGHVSVEVTEKNATEVYAQAKKIAALHKNVVVKIPCHSDYFLTIHRLVGEEIPLNITLVFSAVQATLMAKLGVMYISPFVGRWDDLGVNGMQQVVDMRTIFDTYGFGTQILAASLRHVQHVHEALLAGADVITVPPTVFEKMITHQMTDSGIAQFDTDWKKLKLPTFP
jgi:transaldolase